MVTQVEEVVGSAVDRDGGSTASPLDHLPQYSLDYFESSLGEAAEGYYEATATTTTTTIIPPATTPTVTMTTTHGYNVDKFSSDVVSYYDNKVGNLCTYILN